MTRPTWDELFVEITLTIAKRSSCLKAQQGALLIAARNGIDTEGCSIYCTQSPCISCAKLVVASGIKEFYYISNYRLVDGIKFLDQAGVSIKRINNDS